MGLKLQGIPHPQHGTISAAVKLQYGSLRSFLDAHRDIYEVGSTVTSDGMFLYNISLKGKSKVGQTDADAGAGVDAGDLITQENNINKVVSSSAMEDNLQETSVNCVAPTNNNNNVAAEKNGNKSPLFDNETLSNKSKADLQLQCRLLRLPTYGTKQMMVKRILDVTTM